MPGDLVPRQFKFQQVFFAPSSPWNQYIGLDATGGPSVPAVVDSELQCHATFEALKKGSLLATARGIGDGNLTQAQLKKLAIEFTKIDLGGHLQNPGFNFDQFTFPIFAAKPLSAGTTTVNLTTYDVEDGYPSPTLPAACPNKPCQVTVPLPATAIRPSDPDPREEYSDGAMILVDPANNAEFDFWQATVQTPAGTSAGGGNVGTRIISAGSVSFFDASTSGLGAQVAGPRARSASRASGLPYLGGLLIPEDFERIDYSGGPQKLVIPHALAFTLPYMRALHERFPLYNFAFDYLYPASDHERTAGTVNPYALRAGQRIRLKEQIVDVQGNPIIVSDQSLVVQIFLYTLQNYGAYLVDCATAFGFAAEDYHTAPFADDLATRLTTGPIVVTPVAGQTPWQRLLYELQEQLRILNFQFAVPAKGDKTLQAINFEVVENPHPPRGT